MWMNRAFMLAACSLAFVAALAAPSHAAWTTDVNLNTPVAASAGNQSQPASVGDGAGGLFVVWTDGRGADNDIYGQHVSASGALLWGASGTPVIVSAGAQDSPVLVADGAGGIFVCWIDHGSPALAYAQHLNAAGVQQWGAAGALVASDGLPEANAAMVADGAGGVVISFSLIFSGTDYDPYAQRLDASGARLWSAGGVSLCSLTSIQDHTQVVNDGTGGWIVAWIDGRASAAPWIFGQRLNSTGSPLWGSNGANIIGFTPGGVSDFQLFSDGTGGAYTISSIGTSTDTDIFVSRYIGLLVSGSPSQVIFRAGVPVCRRGARRPARRDVPRVVGHARRLRGPAVHLAHTCTPACRCRARRSTATSSSATGTTRGPALTLDAQGGVIVTWQHRAFGGGGAVQRALRIDPYLNVYAGMVRGRRQPGDDGRRRLLRLGLRRRLSGRQRWRGVLGVGLRRARPARRRSRTSTASASRRTLRRTSSTCATSRATRVARCASSGTRATWTGLRTTRSAATTSGASRRRSRPPRPERTSSGRASRPRESPGTSSAPRRSGRRPTTGSWSRSSRRNSSRATATLQRRRSTRSPPTRASRVS